MQSRVIKTMGAPVLREITPEITEITDQEVQIANKLRLAMATVDAYAIAANQIGYNSRMFVYNINKKYEIVLNPVLTEYSDSLWSFQEGCLSIPGFSFPVWRPRQVLLRGIDLDGRDVRIEASELQARIFQHETDHLNGKLVIDQLNPDELKEFKWKWAMAKKKFRK